MLPPLCPSAVSATNLDGVVFSRLNVPSMLPFSRRLTHSSIFSVVQYQKNEGPGADTSVYRFDVHIKDAYQTTIGEVTTVPDPASVGSALPHQLLVRGGNVDLDPVQFNYTGQTWASDGSVSRRVLPSLTLRASFLNRWR